MTRSQRFTLFLVSCLVLLAVAGTAQAATTASKLLTRYQPVTYFTGDEAFRPTPVDGFIADSTLERFIPPGTVILVDPDPQPDTLPTEGLGWRLNQQPCSPAAGLAGQDCYAASWSSHGEPSTVYGRVDRVDGKVVVQYWYFYYDDFYSYTSPATDFIWQAHEGDWEVVNVVLSEDREPLYVGYSQHCLGERRSWETAPRWRGHHPIVYVARGSHANYPEQGTGTHTWNTACLPPAVLAFFTGAGLSLPADFTSDEASAGPPALGSDETAIVRVSADNPHWMAFPGTWGELQVLHADPIGTQVSGQSPVGPAQHDVWTDPLGTLAGWPAT
jgi:hypothetical protein